MTESRPTVSDVGEAALIERVARLLGKAPAGEVWIGDDAAVVDAPGRMLITTDMLVEGVDFDVAYASGIDVGHKAIAVNASDIAAMGGRPLHAVCAVALRGELDAAWADGLIEGLVEASTGWGIALVGGDVGGGGEISVTVTMTGAPVGDDVILRSGARPGDALCVTGCLGAARAGLVVLRRGLEAFEALAKAQLRGNARVAEAAALVAHRPTAMLDLSDGLAVDLSRLVAASGVGCEVDTSAVPVCPGVEEVEALDPLETAVLGGEDYELLFTIAEERLDAATSAVGAAGAPVTRLGTITDGPALLGGAPLEDWRKRAWQHLTD